MYPRRGQAVKSTRKSAKRTACWEKTVLASLGLLESKATRALAHQGI